MDISILFISLYIGLLIYLANQNEVERRLAGSPEGQSDTRTTIVRWMLYGVAGMKFLYSLLIVQWAFISTNPDVAQQLDVQTPPVDTSAAIANFVLMLVVVVLSFRVIASESFRLTIRRLTGIESQYNPESPIHIVATVLLLAFISFTFDQLVGSGGLSGLAAQASQNGVSLVALVLQDVLLIIGSFLGIGMAIRRDLRGALERLGLTMPTPQDILWGVGIGILLLIVEYIMVGIWSIFVPPDQIAQQSAASDELTRAFNTLPLAFVLSAVAAVSEEILFRGALQPVFGLVAVSAIFALSHIQYALTPATLIVFVVGLGLGWLRRRRNTNSSIVAHFVYDFVQLALQILIVQSGKGSS